MQHTEKYQLNLIETSDPFSPAPLNENTQKLEDTLAAAGVRTAALEGKADGLITRVADLEGKSILIGTYTGVGGIAGYTVSLPFTPSVVLIQQADGGGALIMVVKDRPFYDSADLKTVAEIITGGFRVYDTIAYSMTSQKLFGFIAFP